MLVPTLCLLFVFPILSSAGSVSCIIDDFSKVSSVTERCSEIIVSNITVPAGVTLRFDLKKGTNVTFEGTITFGFHPWKGPLLELRGEGFTVQGKTGSVIDGQGELYWDHLGDKGLTKPQLINVMATGGALIQNLYMRNCPNHCFYLRNCDDVTVSGLVIDVSDGNKNNFTGHNTDGINLGNVSNTIIKNCIVTNQDDCVSINWASNIHISNMDCSGGHGLSLSVVRNPVSNVTYADSIVRRSANGIHIKTHTNGGETEIRDITYKNITLEDITNFGINIQQDYKDGEGTGIPASNIPIVGLTLANITGTMDGADSKPVQIICGDTGCRDWQWSAISITGNSTSSECNYSPSGFIC